MINLNEHNPANVLDDNRLLSLQAVLNRYCLSLTHTPWEAEDLAQDTWVKAIGASKLSSGDHNPEALLLRIAKNTWIDTTRRKTIFHRVLERVKSTENAATDSSTFETEVAIQALIKHLSPLQRTVFLLRDVLGYSALETAEKLETTEGAVKAALFRARHALQFVREDILADGPSISEDAGFRAFLKTVAISYEKGQIPTLLELLQDEHSGTVAIGKMQNLPLRGNLLERTRVQPEMRMAA